LTRISLDQVGFKVGLKTGQSGWNPWRLIFPIVDLPALPSSIDSTKAEALAKTGYELSVLHCLPPISHFKEQAQ